MKRFVMSAIAVLICVCAAFSQTGKTAPDAAELTKLLNEFLAAAGRDDAAVHEKFWADDLIYTRGAGARTNKAEIMQGVRSAAQPKPGDPTAVFTAEDIRIQQYGTTAIVAFKLVSTMTDAGKTQVSRYFNSGTFLKRKGKWQAVSWQATPIPQTDDNAAKEVGKAESDFWRAVLAGDAATLKKMTDETFVWMHHDGNRQTAQNFLEEVGSGKLRYAKLETDKVTVSITGNTGIVRGASARQRVDGTPFTTFYTLTFVNRNGGWKVVSLHTSRNC